MSPDRWRELTGYLIVANVVLAALYDVAARVGGGNESTVSAVLADAGRQWPVVPLIVGALAAHVYWPVRG